MVTELASGRSQVVLPACGGPRLFFFFFLTAAEERPFVLPAPSSLVALHKFRNHPMFRQQLLFSKYWSSADTHAIPKATRFQWMHYSPPFSLHMTH